MANSPYMIGQPASYAMKGPAPEGFASMQTPEQQQGGGMFASRRRGVDIGQFGAMLLAMNNNPLGIQALQQRAQQQQTQDEFKQREMQRQQGLDDHWTQFQREQDYRQAHPNVEPTQLERLMALARIDPNSDEGRQMALDAARNAANPMQGVPYTDAQGNQGIQFIRPNQRSAAPPPPSPGEVRGGHRFRGGNPADPNAWEPLAPGGPASAPGNFPRQDGGAFDFSQRP